MKVDKCTDATVDGTLGAPSSWRHLLMRERMKTYV